MQGTRQCPVPLAHFRCVGCVTGPQSRAATPFGDPRHSLGALIMRRAGLLDFLSPASQQIVGTIQAVAGSAPDASKQLPSRPNALWHNLTALAVVRKTSQCAGTGRRQVKMGQVGMSGWFCHIVLRLVENREQGHRSAPYGSSPTGSSFQASSTSTGPKGPSPQPSGRGRQRSDW